MAKNRKQHKQRKKVSCLGVLLIFCMLCLIAGTLTVNMLFGKNKVPEISGKYYCYYELDDMHTHIPSGTLVIADKSDPVDMNDIVLYINDDNDYRIGIVSYIPDNSSAAEGMAERTYYLTTVTNTVAVKVEQDAVQGVCTNYSPELGLLVNFFTGPTGLIVGMALPCVILLIYLIMMLIPRKDADAELDDEDNDLAFVKSIQEKQQRIAERDAKRRAKKRENQLITDSLEEEEEEPIEDELTTDGKPRYMLSDEEIARLEEEEAARRAERIAAVRNHMEQRRQTETPDGVPLYTTEIITKTHTLSIPKVGDQPLTTTQRQELKPTPTENIPRLTATGHIQIPTPEQIAAEKQAEEALLSRTEELRLRTQEPKLVQNIVTKEEEPADTDAAVEEILKQQSRQAEALKQEQAEEIAAADETVESFVEKVENKAEAIADTAEQAVENVEEAKPKKKKKKKKKTTNANFNDLMAFLDDEQKKLK